MADGFQACVAYRNLADEGAVTVSNPEINMGGGFLRDRHIGRKWRSLGSEAYVIFDLLRAEVIDTVAVLGVNLTADGTTRVRVSSSDSSGAEGELYDSGDVVGAVDPAYGSLIALLPASVTGRYVRVDLADYSIDFIQAGRGVVAKRNQFAVNFSYGWGAGRVDRSRKTESRSGQLFIDRDNSYRVLQLQFDNIPKEQRYGFLEEMNRLNGASEDILFITNPLSDNLGRDTVWGLIEGQEPIVEPYFERFSQSFNIRERL